MKPKKLPIRPLKITYTSDGYPISHCPECDGKCVVVRYRISKSGLRQLVYRCSTGHYFCAFAKGGIEWCVGDVVHIGEMVQKHKEKKMVVDECSIPKKQPKRKIKFSTPAPNEVKNK